MLPAPLLLLAGPLLPALIILALRRWPLVSALVGLGAVAALASLLAAAPLSPTATGRAAWFTGGAWGILGRAFTLTEGTRALFLVIYGAAGFLFLLSIWLPQGSGFVAAGLAALSPLAGMAMGQPFIFGPPLMLATAALVVWLIQSGRAASIQTAWRYFLLMALAALLVLLAGRLIEIGQPGAGWLLLWLGLTIWLAGFPFYIWLPPIVEDGPPLGVVFLFGLVHLVVALFAWQILTSGSLPGAAAAFGPFFRLSGLATMITGGALAFTAQGSGRLLGYTLLIDVGATLLALAEPAAFAALSGGLTMRLVSLTLAAIGLSLLGHDPFTPGLAYRRPLAVALYALGVLSLAGLPLTPGFSGRWGLVAQLSSDTPWLAPMLLLAAVGGAAGLLRGLVRWLTPTELETAQQNGRGWERIVCGLLLAAGLYLALFPQTLLAYTYQLASLLQTP
ncbi:MAG: proton-conducting transporter membrane subunit [Chloroflexota bacterium]